MVYNFPRLTNGGQGFSLELWIQKPLADRNGKLYFFIIVSHDGGSRLQSFYFDDNDTPHKMLSSFFAYGIISSTFVFVLIPSLIAFFLLLPMLMNSTVMNKLKRFQQLFKIQKEILEVKNTLEDNKNDYAQYKIFSYAIENDKIKKHDISPLLFDSYKDYCIVNNFYLKLSERNQIFYADKNGEDNLGRYNEEYVSLAKTAIKDVQWVKYGLLTKILKRKKIFAFVLGSVIPGLGHIYLKHKLRGIMILIFSPYFLLSILYLAELFGSLNLYDESNFFIKSIFNSASTGSYESLFPIFLALFFYTIVWIWQLYDLKQIIFHIENIEH